jgi:hypothetical protein
MLILDAALTGIVVVVRLVVIRLGFVVAIVRLALVVVVGLIVVRLHGGGRARVGQRLRWATAAGETAERATHGGCGGRDDEADDDVGEERRETRKHDRKQGVAMREDRWREPLGTAELRSLTTGFLNVLEFVFLSPN